MVATLDSLNVSDLLMTIFTVIAGVICYVMVIGLLMSFAVRLKLGK